MLLALITTSIQTTLNTIAAATTVIQFTENTNHVNSIINNK